MPSTNPVVKQWLVAAYDLETSSRVSDTYSLDHSEKNQKVPSYDKQTRDALRGLGRLRQMSPTLFRSIGEHIALIDSVDFPRGSSPGSANSGDIDDVGDDRSLSSTPPASDARRGRLEERGRSIKVHELGSKETEEDEHMRWSRSPTLPRKAADPRKPIALPVAHPVNSLGNPPQPPVNHGRKPVQSFNPPQSSVRTYVESPRKQAEIHRVEAWRQWQEPQRQWSGGF